MTVIVSQPFSFYPVLMTLPGDATLGNNKDYYQNLLNLMGVPNDLNLHSVGLNFWDEIFSSSYNLDFGMSISIQSGPHISIANSQIVQPDATILSDGSVNYNDTVNEVNVIGLLPPNAKDTVQLGRQFLSGAYLMVNEDHGTFTLWQATGDSDKSLVAVDENNVVSTPTCSSTAVTSPLPTGSLSSSPSAHPSPPKSTTSSIVGPVVGAIAGVVLLVALGVFFWMRKRKNKAVRAADNSPYAHNVDEKAIALYNYGAPERNNSAHELWGNPVNEVGGKVTPEEEKNKQSTAASGIHELEHSY